MFYLNLNNIYTVNLYMIIEKWKTVKTLFPAISFDERGETWTFQPLDRTPGAGMFYTESGFYRRGSQWSGWSIQILLWANETTPYVDATSIHRTSMTIF